MIFDVAAVVAIASTRIGWWSWPHGCGTWRIRGTDEPVWWHVGLAPAALEWAASQEIAHKLAASGMTPNASTKADAMTARARRVTTRVYHLRGETCDNGALPLMDKSRRYIRL